MIRKFIVFMSSLLAVVSGTQSIASKASDQASLETRVQNVQRALKNDHVVEKQDAQSSRTGRHLAQFWNNNWNDWNDWNDWDNYWNNWDNWANY